MPAPILFLSDLDHTLFQSLGSNPKGLHAMTVDRQGKDHGFATKAQGDLMKLMGANGVTIPVTARSHEQLERVVGWDTESAYNLALTDLGATLLVRDNFGDKTWCAVEEWQDFYADEAEKHIELMTGHYQLIDSWINFLKLQDRVSLEVIGWGKLDKPLYIAITARDADDDALKAQILNMLAAPILSSCKDITVNISGPSTCLWPTFVTKAKATKRLLENLEGGFKDSRVNRALTYMNIQESTIVTMGDNKTDLEFMLLGDFMLTPTNSEISETSAKSAGLLV